MSGPLVSIVVPVFKTASYLPRCLDSIMHQTYKNIQIIIVDDGSPGDAKSIALKYVSNDPRIEYVAHETNRGLFQARITGAEKAEGQYIAFVDSDDYIGADMYRRLVESAIEVNADIVCANFMLSYENGEQAMSKLNRISEKSISGSNILDAFFKQEGRHYHWHVIWNKLYKKSLWNRCMPYYAWINKHLVMTEDFAFTVPLFKYASRYAAIDYNGYFYHQTFDSSTSATIKSTTKYLKIIEDIETSFSFVEKFLISTDCYARYAQNLYNWKQYFANIWGQNIKDNFLGYEQKDLLAKLCNSLDVSMDNNTIESNCKDSHFERFITKTVNYEEDIILKFLSSDIEYVSFDIFDTLVKRPFFEPHDLFVLLRDYVVKDLGHKELYLLEDIRVKAEQEVRKKLRCNPPFYEEVGIKDIYDYMVDKYAISAELADVIMYKEMELELKYCEPRTFVKELFYLANYLAKKVIVISDTYLPDETINHILKKCGYSNFHKLYLSSNIKLTKASGNIYSYVVSDLNTKANRIIHLGDNYKSDYENSESNGLHSYFVPRAMSVFLGDIPELFPSPVNNFLREDYASWTDRNHYLDYFGLRCMLGVVGNQIFDNPYLMYYPDTLYAADPYFIGYYPIGMQMFGLAKWIVDDSIKNNKTIHFAARDGYLLKKIFDLFCIKSKTNLKSNYLVISRKALFPVLVKDRLGLATMDEYMDIYKQTPESFITENMPDEIVTGLLALLVRKGFIIEQFFRNNYEFRHFISALSDCIDEYGGEFFDNSALRLHFDNIFNDHDAIYDIGYNGTCQLLISMLLGKPIDAYYFSINKDKAIMNQNCYTGKSKYFLDFTPVIKGTICEYVLSEPSSSCIKYQTTGKNKVVPLFQDNFISYHDDFILNAIHKGAVQFAEKMLHYYNDHLRLMTYRNYEVSFPFLKFLHESKYLDRQLFKYGHFEDSVSARFSSTDSILDIWEEELVNRGLLTRELSSKHAPNNNPEENNVKQKLLMHSKIKIFINKIKKRLMYRYWYSVIQQSGLFDRVYYLSENTDVNSAGIDPIGHYLLYGADEGRNPSANFNTTEYIVQNLNITEKTINPLVHYVFRKEQREKSIANFSK
jgi:glycosyltransferase involved in cell wall biosynthesis/FMN phosphatase YigB (HAD superfamily)